ncbi:MAG TPA: hypothetical protein EYP04_09610 [Anaerolineae bacterium]|nr:hypothetical protein [Anaerolineae bacterium]
MPAEIAAGLLAWVQAEQARRMQIDAWMDALVRAGMPAAPHQESEPDPRELLLDLAQFALDIAGTIEPTPFCDGTNAIVSLFRGDLLGAGCSAVAIIPYLGDLAKLGKLGKHIDSAFAALRLAAKNPAFAMKVAPVLKKLKILLDKLPINGLSDSVGKRLSRLRDEIGDFLGPRSGGPRYRSIYDDGTLVVDGQQPVRLPLTADPAATGADSRVRYDTVNNRVYQLREFDANANLVRDIDLTNPTFPNGTPRPGHPGPPHQHRFEVNDSNVGPRSGFRRLGPEPLGGGS